MDTSILKMLDRASEKYAGKVVYRDGEEELTQELPLKRTPRR